MTAEWMTRDHVLVVQAARNLDAEPIYAGRLWAEANNPMVASLQLIDLLIRERADVTEPEAEAYQAGYGDGLEDAQNPDVETPPRKE